jgi:hypothetical protein
MALSSGPVLSTAFWVLAAGFLILLARSWRRLRAGSWADWASVAVALALLPLAARSARHIGAWLLVAPVAASRLLGADVRWRRAPAPASPDHPGLNALIVAVLGAAGVVAVARLWAEPFPRLNWRPVPEGALAAVRACPGPLYNHYDQGGYLVWLVPERKVFIDNRQDPYPLSLLLEQNDVESGRRSPLPLLERWGALCSFLSVKSPTVAALTAAGWATTFRDPDWAVQAAP